MEQTLESNQQLNKTSIDEQKREKSRRIKIALLALAAVLIAVGGILLFAYFNKSPGINPIVSVQCSQLAQEIDTLTKQANYCEVNEDCVATDITTGNCGCVSVQANKDADLAELRVKTQRWDQNCRDASITCEACPPPQFAKCEQNQCVGVWRQDDSATDTSSWQTYRNEEFGFEVKYPEFWDYREYSAGDPLQLHFYTSSIGNLSRRVYDTTPPDDPSIPQPLKATIELHVNFGTFDRCPCLEGPQNIVVGGMSAKRMKFSTVEVVDVTKNEYTFSLLRETIQRSNTDNSVSSENAMAIFDQMLSTFRFVP